MAISEHTGGSHLIGTLDTEETLFADQSAANVYVLSIDTSALVNGEVLIVRLNQKVRSGGTAKQAWESVISNIQDSPVKWSPPIPSPFGLDGKIEQEGGTKRTFIWSLYKL